MAELDYSFTEEELLTEVRNSLAGIDSAKIPDDTIKQTADRFVVPLLNSIGNYKESNDQDAFDNAVIAWTAEKSFSAWMAYTRLRDREVEAYVDPEGYRQRLKERTDNSLSVLGVVRPPRIPNTVITVQHDGEQRRVNLDQEWVPE